MERPDVYRKVYQQTLLTGTLEVGTDGFVCVHLVFERSMLLFLVEVPFVPGYNGGVCNHSACVSVGVRQITPSVARASAHLVGSKFRTWSVSRDVARERPTYA